MENKKDRWWRLYNLIRTITNSPDEQTLLTVVQHTFFGRPAKIAAWRAGACPNPAETTFPMMTSLTSSLAIPARWTALSIAVAPSWEADNGANELWKEPIGVLAADTITTSLILRVLELYCLRAYKKLYKLKIDRKVFITKHERSNEFCIHLYQSFGVKLINLLVWQLGTTSLWRNFIAKTRKIVKIKTKNQPPHTPPAENSKQD